MPVSNLMMVETSLLFGLISKFGMYTGLGKTLLSKIITLLIGSGHGDFSVHEEGINVINIHIVLLLISGSIGLLISKKLGR